MTSTEITPEDVHPMLLWHLSERDRQTFELDTSSFSKEVVESAVSWYRNILCLEYGGKPHIYSNDPKEFSKVFPLLVSFVLQLDDLIVFDQIVNSLSVYSCDNDMDPLCVIYAKKLMDHPHFIESAFADDFKRIGVHLLYSKDLCEYLVDKLNNHPKGVYYVHRLLMTLGGKHAFNSSKSWSSKIMNFKDKLAL